MAYAPKIWTLTMPSQNVGMHHACYGIAVRINKGKNHFLEKQWRFDADEIRSIADLEKLAKKHGTPDIIISGGYLASGVIGELSLNRPPDFKKTTLAQIYKPNFGEDEFYGAQKPKFDFLASEYIPHNIGMNEKNTYEMVFVPHKVGKTFLEAISVRLDKGDFSLKDSEKKILSVCIGGMGEDDTGAIKGYIKGQDKDFAEKVATMAQRENYKTIVNFSNRTSVASEKRIRGILETKLGKENVIFNYGKVKKEDYPNTHKMLPEVPNYIYYSMKYADKIIVTSDSVSMLSEAATFRKPLELYNIGDNDLGTISRAEKELLKRGVAQVFDGTSKEFPEKIPRVKNPAAEIAKMITKIHLKEAGIKSSIER